MVTTNYSIGSFIERIQKSMASQVSAGDQLERRSAGAVQEGARVAAAAKQDIDAKVAQVDQASASYIVHQKDHCRNRIAELSIQLQHKKEHQKKVKAKLLAYKEVLALV
eukprot:CAMPEP_0170456022 /NCGR_PEP_ID=MMETSP0123-20130129/3794_1 /TAXON_ID=182087 /ORGANISM="Favella ehrenbergii, Strain Fehren 1" /LENGTH=108 /DNA_ID=CAMNT_0010719359 /DNA_START=801 /DNA_END=1128 /DNA_ORIENTATION=-